MENSCISSSSHAYTSPIGARIAIFTLVDWSLSVLRTWAEAEGHEIAILVTQPPAPGGTGIRDLAGSVPGAVAISVPEVDRCRAALIDCEVDLGVVFTFRRIPERVASIPRLGVVNLHPSLLPAYRGPNGYRAIYEQAPLLGATAHRLTDEFDAGPILAQASEPTPAHPGPAEILEVLKRTATGALRSGVPRALAGEPGEPQQDAMSTSAPRFTEAERVLSLRTSTRGLQCRFSALALAGIQPTITLGDADHPLQAIQTLTGVSAPGPGVITLAGRRAVAATQDGVVELALGRLPY